MGLPGELAGLAHRHEARPEREGDRWGEDEAARLHADHDVDAGRPGLVEPGGGERGHDRRQPVGVREDGGDVLEHHPRLGVIGDVEDQPRECLAPDLEGPRPHRCDDGSTPGSLWIGMSSAKLGTAAYGSAAARSRALARFSASFTSSSVFFRCTSIGVAMHTEE